MTTTDDNRGRERLREILSPDYPRVSVNDELLCGAYRLESLTLCVSLRRSEVGLDLVVVREGERHEGNGTRFLQDLCGVCDELGYTVGLFVSPDFGASSKRRLEAFYRRFGFRPNRGRHADLSSNYSMLRQPQKTSV